MLRCNGIESMKADWLPKDSKSQRKSLNVGEKIACDLLKITQCSRSKVDGKFKAGMELRHKIVWSVIVEDDKHIFCSIVFDQLKRNFTNI